MANLSAPEAVFPVPGSAFASGSLPAPAAGATGVDPMLPRPFRVVDAFHEIHDTATLVLEPADGGPPLDFRPGQFTMLYLPGVGEVPISISGNPTDNRWLVHTIRAVGAITRGLCACTPGDLLGVRGPYGTAWPVREATSQDVVLVAGGVGLAPLRPVFYELLAHRSDYGRVVLLYGARTPKDLLFRQELETWRGRFDLEVHVTVDNSAEETWYGEVGVVTRMIRRAPFDAGHTTAFICGPEVMVRFTIRELEDRGVEPEAIHVSLERNMRCGVGLCGHCQLGPEFVCTDGPVFPLPRVEHLLSVREL